MERVQTKNIEIKYFNTRKKRFDFWQRSDKQFDERMLSKICINTTKEVNKLTERTMFITLKLTKCINVLSDKNILQNVLTLNISNAFKKVYLHLKSFLKDVKLMFISKYKPLWKKIWFLHQVTSAL